MRLLDRSAVGTGSHRSGWPCVMRELKNRASDTGILLDDFADASFSYKPIKEQAVGGNLPSSHDHQFPAQH